MEHQYKITYSFEGLETGTEIIDAPLAPAEGGILAVMDFLDNRNDYGDGEPAERTIGKDGRTGQMLTEDGHTARIEAVN